MPTSEATAAAPHGGLAALATPPNLVTLARVGLIAAAAVAWWCGARTAGVVLGVVAGATDLLDGHLARRLGLASRFGAMLDQFADGFLVLVALAVALEPPVALPAAYLVAAMARELWVHGVRRDAAAVGLEIPSSRLGKASSALVGWGMVPLFAGALGARPGLAALGEAALAVGLALGALAAAGYTARYLRHLPASRSA